MDVPPKKKKPFGGPASRCARSIAADSADGNHCSNPLFAPPDKRFRKEDGGRGGEGEKPFFKRGSSLLGHHLSPLSFFSSISPAGEQFGGPASRCARPIAAGFCRRQPLLQSAFRPSDKSFRKEDGGCGGKEKSPFSKGFSPSPRSSSLSSLKKRAAPRGKVRARRSGGGAAGAAVLLQWVSRRGRRRSGTWCLRRGS